MSIKRILYVILIAVVAGISALSGVVAGGALVYRAVQARTSLPAPIQEVLPANNTNPGQTLTLNTTNIQTDITQAVQKVGPAVVTVVGTIPGQPSFFGSSGDQTVSGSGIFISDQGYILTNNHVVEGTNSVTIVLSNGSQEKAAIVGTDQYNDIAVLKADGKVPAVATLGNSDVLKPGEIGDRHRLPLGRFQEHGHGRRGQRHGTFD